jgi:hypothetical protein
MRSQFLKFRCILLDTIWQERFKIEGHGKVKVIFGRSHSLTLHVFLCCLGLVVVSSAQSIPVRTEYRIFKNQNLIVQFSCTPFCLSRLWIT